MKFQLGFLLFFVCVMVAVGDAVENSPPVEKEKVCEPEKEFTKDCSVCKCNGSGTEYTCEKRDCPETQKVTEVATETAEDKCTPGENFKIKCNECKCPESGLKSQAACTVIGCSDE